VNRTVNSAPGPVDTRASARAPTGFSLRRSASALAQSDGRLGWAPIVAALTIDLADIATAGPLGLIAGVFVGGVLTLIVAMASGAKLARAALLGLFGAAYCALPLTEALPLATMLTLLYGFMLRKQHTAAKPALVPVDQPERSAINAA